MRSTGEVMGIDTTFGLAFYKAELAAGTVLPTEGTVFLSLADGDKPAGIVVARRLRELGLGIAATTGTADYLASFGVSVDAVVGKISDGHGINAVNLIAGGDIAFVDQHAARPRWRRTQRRRADPQGRHHPPGQLGDHRRGRAGRCARHGRTRRPRPLRPLAAGISRVRAVRLTTCGPMRGRRRQTLGAARR